MRNKWLAYAASLVLTASVVTASLFLPQVLLQRQEDRMLGVDINQGQSHLLPEASYASAPSLSPTLTAGSSTAQPSYSLENIVDKIRLLENASAESTYQHEPTEGEMTMKQAVACGIDQITEYMKAGAMLPLANFPDDYAVLATLNTIHSKTGETMDYWSIKFAVNSDSTDRNSGINMLMDAVTGTILSYNMSLNPQQKQPDLIAGVTFIAAKLGLEGSILDDTVTGTQVDSVTWVSGNKSLYITLSCSASGVTAMSMKMSTQLQVP
jgi:hypothetical protein